MKGKISKIMQKKMTYKIVAVFFGIVVWFFVLDFTNPWITKSVDVPLVIQNESDPIKNNLANSTITAPTTITVKVKGREDSMSSLVISDLRAYVDFKEISSTGVHKLDVEVESKKIGIKVEEISTRSIEFTFDKYVDSYINVQVDFDDALLSENYKVLKISYLPDRVPISGFETQLNEIDKIRVSIKDNLNVASIDSDKTINVLGKYFDKNGEDMSYKYEAERITVSIEVAKEVPLIYKVSGNPATDYYVNSSNISQATVLLKGSPEDLSKISEIDLGSFDITGATDSISKNKKVTVPSGVVIYGSSDVIIRVEVFPYITKTFEINDSVLNKPGIDIAKYDYKISPVNYTISIKGKAKDLDGLQRSSLNPTIDVLGRSEGAYKIPLTVTVPADSILIGEYFYDVTITIKQSPSPSISATP